MMVGGGLLTVGVWTVRGRFLRKVIFQVQFSDHFEKISLRETGFSITFQNDMFSFFEITLRKRKACISFQLM